MQIWEWSGNEQLSSKYVVLLTDNTVEHRPPLTFPTLETEIGDRTGRDGVVGVCICTRVFLHIYYYTCSCI